MARTRPTPEELAALAKEPGMTFAKMGRILQVDRKTAKRWCLEAGIDRVGKNLLKPEPEDEALPAVPGPQVQEKEETRPDKGPNITSIAEKVSKGEFDNLTDKEKMAFDALAAIIKAVMAKTIEAIHSRIDNHYHTILSTAQGKQYMRERRQRTPAGTGSRGENCV